jgi:hypothetical protein
MRLLRQLYDDERKCWMYDEVVEEQEERTSESDVDWMRDLQAHSLTHTRQHLSTRSATK